MATEPRAKIAAVLSEGVGPTGSFSAQRAAQPDDLQIEVRGVGPLQFPVPPEQARHLRAIARPARFGLGTETVIDDTVRDT